MQHLIQQYQSFLVSDDTVSCNNMRLIHILNKQLLNYFTLEDKLEGYRRDMERGEVSKLWYVERCRLRNLIPIALDDYLKGIIKASNAMALAKKSPAEQINLLYDASNQAPGTFVPRCG